MQKKTKAKIEAMAQKYDRNGTRPVIHLEKIEPHILGATPWAEWCERFEACLVQPENSFSQVKNQQFIMICEEYRQWLEEK